VPCHPERSEGSDAGGLEAVSTSAPQVPRYAQDDKVRLVVKLNVQECKEDTRLILKGVFSNLTWHATMPERVHYIVQKTYNIPRPNVLNINQMQ